MNSIPIRLADASSLEDILPLFRAYQAHYHALTAANEEQTRRFLAGLIEDPRAGFILVAEDAGKVIGFASGYFTVSGLIAERLVHLGDLFVAPGYRRRGVATALVEAVTATARMHGIALVRWLSLAANTELNGWYDSLAGKGGEFRLYLRPTGTVPRP